MKVIFIHLLNDYSGSTRVMSDIVDTCKINSINFDLYYGKGGDGFLNNKIKNPYLFFYKRNNNKFLTLIFYLISQIILFFRMLKYFKCDCKIYINTMLSFGPALAGRLMGKEIIFHVHETSIKPKLLKDFLKKIISITSNKVIYVSQYLKDNENIKNLKSTVIYNSLPDSLYSESINHSFTKKNNFNILMACSLRDYKGVKEFIDIAEICSVKKNVNFTLILNADKKEINAYFKDINIPKNTKVLTKQPNLVPYYKNSHLVLNLSRIDQWIETFGLTILEAMAFGIPVIAPPIGGPCEIVRDGKDGFLISSYDSNKIASTIFELTKNDNLWLELSKNCKNQAKKFDTQTFKDNIIKIIEANS